MWACYTLTCMDSIAVIERAENGLGQRVGYPLPSVFATENLSFGPKMYGLVAG